MAAFASDLLKAAAREREAGKEHHQPLTPGEQATFELIPAT